MGHKNFLLAIFINPPSLYLYDQGRLGSKIKICICIIFIVIILIRYSIFVLFYMYYEKFVEKDQFLVFSLLDSKKSSKTKIGISSKIEKLSNIYELEIFN